MKRDKTDAIFSLYIRTRDKWTCQKCGKVYEQGSQGLHCSHVFGRRHKSVRWDEHNAKALCFFCHKWYGENPTESGEWVKAYLDNRWGPETYNSLRQRKNTIARLRKQEKENILNDIKEKLANVERDLQNISYQD